MAPESRSGDVKQDDRPVTFETALSRLENIVDRLERGEITLDESIDAFREGSHLVRFCLDRLTAAEEQVQKLVGGESGPTLLPMEPDTGDRGNE